jgi:hypothetical protein
VRSKGLAPLAAGPCLAAGLLAVLTAAWLTSALVAHLGGPAAVAGLGAAGALLALAGLWTAAHRPRGAWALGLRGALLGAALSGELVLGLGETLVQAAALRGDWFLDGVGAAWAEPARSGVLAVADGLAAAQRRLAPNPFAADGPPGRRAEAGDERPPASSAVSGGARRGTAGAEPGPGAARAEGPGGSAPGSTREGVGRGPDAPAAPEPSPGPGAGGAGGPLQVQPGAAQAGGPGGSAPRSSGGAGGPLEHPDGPPQAGPLGTSLASGPPAQRSLEVQPGAAQAGGPGGSAPRPAGEGGRGAPGLEPGVPAGATAAQDDLLLTNREGDLRWARGEPLPEAGLSVLPATPQVVDPASGSAPVDPPAHAPGAASPWPQDAALHPAVAGLPPRPASPEALAEAVARASRDPQEQLRILHDWIATNVAYDDEGRAAGRLGSPDPQDVLTSGRAVCAGFARLFAAAGEALGLEVAFVVGRGREGQGTLSDHAWNAVRLADGWALVDVTWDVTRFTSGRVQAFSTDYLLTPPEVFGVDHLPEDPRWQLRSAPLSLAAFLRQPHTRPALARHGVTLRAPARAEVQARGAVEVALSNPRGRHLSASLVPPGEAPAARGAPCGAGSTAADVNLTCTLPGSGRYTVKLWVGLRPTGTQTLAGTLQVDADG